MVEFCRGERRDEEDILDFANYVFSAAHQPHDFQMLLPKVYGKGAGGAEYHYLAKDDGKIKAMVCVLPTEFKSGTKVLKAGMLGTVSVHPYARKQGYMKRLMEMAVADMRAEGYAFSALGGQRQRYEYFGYEPCGVQINFTVTSTNIHHHVGFTSKTGIQFVQVEESDVSLLDQVYSFYQRRAITGRRRKDFYRICQSWQSTLYAIINHHQECIGYAIVSRDAGQFSEIELADVSKLPQVCKAYFQQMNRDTILISLAAYERKKISVLAEFCERYEIGTNESFQIFDYRRVIQMFLEIKAQSESLKDGRFRLEIEGEAPMEILVQAQRVQISKTEEMPDLMLSRRSAMGLLCSPIFGYGAYGEDRSRLPAGWFPLPLYISGPDGF